MNADELRAAFAALQQGEDGEGFMYTGDSSGSESLDEREAYSIMALNRQMNAQPVCRMRGESGDMDDGLSDGSDRAETITDSEEDVWSEPDAPMSSGDEDVDGDAEAAFERRPSIRTDYLQESSHRDLAANLPKGIQLMTQAPPRVPGRAETVVSAPAQSSYREKFLAEFRLAETLSTSEVVKDLFKQEEVVKWGETQEINDEPERDEEHVVIPPISDATCAQVELELNLFSARAPYVERMTDVERQIEMLIKKAELLGSITQHTPIRGLDAEAISLRSLRAQSQHEADVENMYDRYTQEAHRQYQKISYQLS